jgi:putative hydrolase of the HAD superfamily
VPAGRDRFAFFPGGEEGFWRRLVARALNHAGADLDPDAVTRVLERLRRHFAGAGAWSVYPEVPAVLAALRADGVRLAIVSNWDSRLPSLLDTLGLAADFEVLAVSHLEGVEKPAPELFWRAVDRLGVRREQVLHAGNLADVDVAGARAAGIDAVLVDRAGPARHERGVIHDLSPLPEIARRGLVATEG